MRLETLLPLGKVDPGLRAPEVPLDLRTIGRDAKLLEELGYDRLVVEETKDDPFVLMALAAEATRTLGLGTSVAIAFPRSPTITAMSAWTIQKLSQGRFTLGLGPQVKAHIERRYGLAWAPAGPWMREYVTAVRAVWAHWQHGTPLDIQGPHYNINLMVPLFNPGPIAHPDIPIHLAAVNSVMCRVAGEVADGIRLHPVCTPSYIEAGHAAGGARGSSQERPLARRLPGLHEAADRRRRDRRGAGRQGARHPRPHLLLCLDAAVPCGLRPSRLGDLADRLKLLSRAQRWEEMPQHISDDILHTFVTVGTYDTIGAKLTERFGRVITHCEFSIAVRTEADKARLKGLADGIQGQSLDPARRTILGQAA